MTGWSTFTIDAESYDARNTLQDELLREASERGIRMSTSIYNGYLLARIVQYRDWEEDYELLGEVLEHIERVCIVHANDTSDTGAAQMLHRRKKETYMYDEAEAETDEYVLLLKDTYTETPDEDGRQVGTKAASVMHATHNIPAVARPNRHLYDKKATRDLPESNL